jgi:hypothetical protein
MLFLNSKMYINSNINIKQIHSGKFRPTSGDIQIPVKPEPKQGFKILVPTFRKRNIKRNMPVPETRTGIISGKTSFLFRFLKTPFRSNSK